jgi:hypothetical protein
MSILAFRLRLWHCRSRRMRTNVPVAPAACMDATGNQCNDEAHIRGACAPLRPRRTSVHSSARVHEQIAAAGAIKPVAASATRLPHIEKVAQRAPNVMHRARSGPATVRLTRPTLRPHDPQKAVEEAGDLSRGYSGSTFHGLPF